MPRERGAKGGGFPRSFHDKADMDDIIIGIQTTLEGQVTRKRSVGDSENSTEAKRT